MEENIRSAIDSHVSAARALSSHWALIGQIASAIAGCVAKGGKVLICGNGGSAADSQHIAAELVGRFKRERRALAAQALTTNTSILTAIANDYDYSRIFERQLEALAGKGDLAIGISTSGKAKNVIRGLEKARTLGLVTLVLTGKNGDNLRPL